MPRVAVPIVKQPIDGTFRVNFSGAIAPDPTNHHELKASPSDKLVLIAQNATASTKTITVKKGTDPSLSLGGADLVLQVFSGEHHIFGPFDQWKYVQSGGLFHLDLQAGYTSGSLQAVLLP